MRKTTFTANVVEKAQCDPEKKQTIFHDAKTPGLGLRVTNTGSKSYVFESKLHGKTMRITIGSPQTWPLKKAQTEAARLKVMIDQGIDPRQLKAEQIATKQAEDAARKAQEAREIVTVRMAWNDYVEARKPLWSELHIRDHEKIMQAGGEPRARSKKLTEPGSLAALAEIRLVDLTPELVTEWAQAEALTRPTRARLALRLLRAFLNWCGRHSTYRAIVTSNPAQNHDARELLGRPKVKHDVLQREQLSAWFDAVRKIQNPVISAYLQVLLLTGARREEIAALRWENVDFQWNSLTTKDKYEDFRIIPLTPYISSLLASLPRRNQWVFSSPTAESGHITDPTIAHRKACAIAGLYLTLHGLRRSFATLCEWIEMPAGIAAQIQGHKPQGVREKSYIRRPLDLLRKWHVKIEEWILQEAGIEYTPTKQGLHAVSAPNGIR